MNQPAGRRTWGRVAGVLCLCVLAGCQLAGYGRVQPRHVQGTWRFRPAGAPECGVDSLVVALREPKRTWGSFFINGEARAFGAAGASEPRRLTHGRVEPQSGDFTLVFADREAPNATHQFELQGRFEDTGRAEARFTRLLPEPQCGTSVAGARDG